MAKGKTTKLTEEPIPDEEPTIIKTKVQPVSYSDFRAEKADLDITYKELGAEYKLEYEEKLAKIRASWTSQ